MHERVNKIRIYRLRDREVSKTEAEEPEYMKKQRFTDEEIKILQKKLEQWEIDHSWKCTCGNVNRDLEFDCKCGNRKPSKKTSR